MVRHLGSVSQFDHANPDALREAGGFKFDRLRNSRRGCLMTAITKATSATRGGIFGKTPPVCPGPPNKADNANSPHGMIPYQHLILKARLWGNLIDVAIAF